jgi:hypothetical protein
MNDINKSLKKQFSKKILKHIPQLEKIMLDKFIQIYDGQVNNPPADISKNFIARHTVTEGALKLQVYSPAKYPLWLDQGTKKYIIKPKPGKKALVFKVEEVVYGKNGHKYNYGDFVFAKQVNHPGIKARPWIELASYLTMKEIQKIFK